MVEGERRNLHSKAKGRTVTEEMEGKKIILEKANADESMQGSQENRKEKGTRQYAT